VTATEGAISGHTTVTVTTAVLESIAVTPIDPSLPSGETQQLTATGRYSDGSTQNITDAVNWASVDTSIAGVSATGLVTGADVGSTTVSATDNSTGISGNTLVTVTTAVLESIAVTPIDPFLPSGETQQLTATGRYSDGSTQDITDAVTWASVNTSIAGVSATGLVTGADVGSTTVSATDNSTGISGNTLVTVTTAVLESIAVTPIDPFLPSGETQQLTATGRYSDGSTQDITDAVTWASVNTSIAGVSATGLVTGADVGSTTVSATDNSTGISGNTTVTVTAAVLESIAVTPANPSLPLGETQQMVATGTYSDGSTQVITGSVTWLSGTPGVATITSGGLVSSVATGTSQVTATEGAISGHTTVTVTTAVLESIAVTPIDPSLPSGETQQLTATGRYSDGSTQNITDAVNWVSVDTSIARVNATGLVTGADVGSTTVSATDNSTGISGNTTVTVTSSVLESIAITPANPSIFQGHIRQLRAIGTYLDGSTRDLTSIVTWSSANPNIASVSAGLVTGIHVGTAVITAEESITGISGSTNVKVLSSEKPSFPATSGLDSTKAMSTPSQMMMRTQTPKVGVPSAIVLDVAPTLKVGEVTTIVVDGLDDGLVRNVTPLVTWENSDPHVATVDEDGVVTAIAPGATTITASIEGVVTNKTTIIVED